MVNVKMHGSVLEEKSSFKILGLLFSSILDCGSYIISIVKSLVSFYEFFQISYSRGRPTRYSEIA